MLNNYRAIIFKRIVFIFLLIQNVANAQHTLDNFVTKAIENSPLLKEYQYQQTSNQLQQKLNTADISAVRISLTGNYLFTPYFNNHGDLITTNPSPEAIGYDINLFDGGLYSVQLNLERNIFNGRRINVFDRQIQIQNENTRYNLDLEKHNLRKQVIDQYLNTYQSLLLIRLAQEMITNLSNQLRLTAALVEKGFIKTQDYLLLKIEVQNQSISLRDARQNYRSRLYQLYALCGIQDTTVQDIDSVALQINTPIAKSNFMQRYTLDSLATVNRQTLFEIKYLPQVSLFFNTGLNAVELNNIRRKFGLSAGLSLSVPLYDGRQKSLTRQQSFVTQNTISEYRWFSERNITLQQKDMLTRINTLRQNIQALTEQIADYNILLLLSEKQLQQGNVSMIDQLSFLKNFVSIRKNKIEMEINYQLEINNYNYWNW